MNKKFKLQNFRVFDDKGADFEIAPITVLTGCNSSGKSSAIKALMLLKQYFNTLKDDYTNGKPINMKEYELLFNKGKHNLGTFQKTLSKYVKSTKNSPIMTFSWTKYSHLLAQDIEVEVSFVENHKTIFNNAVIKDIKIIQNNREIVLLDFSNDFDFHIDYQFFKNEFFSFVQFVKHYNGVVNELGINEDEGTVNRFKTFEELALSKGINIQAIESILYVEEKLIKRDGINSLISECSEIPAEAIANRVLLYLPILEWLDGIPKKEISKVLWAKLEESDLDGSVEFITKELKRILQDFEKSKFKTFKQYYIENFENQLTKCFCLKYDQKVNDGNKSAKDKSLLIKETITHINFSLDDDWDLVMKTISSSTRGFLDEIQSYISLKSMMPQQNKFDIKFWKGLDNSNFSESYNNFMLLIAYCLYVDKDFENKRLIKLNEGLKSEQIAFFDTKEYNAAKTFILSVIQDSIFNVPSFIENIDFVEAVRANVQRIYAFNQNGDFNELILSYLNSSNTKKDLNRLGREKNFGIEIKEENGLRSYVIPLQHPTEENNQALKGYILGNFTRKWIRVFEIADDVIFENTTEGLGVLIYLVKGGKKELLADQGYGITQLLAILLKIEMTIIKSEFEYSNPFLKDNEIGHYESTISIEEPETNLHPKFQSILADMFMDAYKIYNVRFIIETHSEYLIRKLQTLVAKKVLTPDDVALHYIYNHDKSKRPVGKPQVLNIKIKEDGRLSEPFGSGFFDESTKLMMDLISGVN